MKSVISIQIGINMKKQFDLFKARKGVVTNAVGQVIEGSRSCPCCQQSLPNHYTQEWLGIQCGMTKNTIVHYFQGNRVPSVLNLLKVSKVLECTLSDLLDGVDPSMLPEEKS